jgi:hypothetical protein
VHVLLHNINRVFALLPGSVELAADERALLLGQVVEDISALVLSASLNQGAIAERGFDCGPNALAAIDYDQARPLRVEATVDQAGK